MVLWFLPVHYIIYVSCYVIPQEELINQLVQENSALSSKMEDTSTDGNFIWKISDLARKRQEVVMGRTPSIYSPSFFTKKTGKYIAM